jgi:glycosyltransferase involved in cell wall biosynthesis
MSPRGTLDRWALRHRAWRKAVMWRLGQKANLLTASCLHATAEQEHVFFRELGLRAPVAVIPNGVDIPPPRPLPNSGDPRLKRLLFLARIHPKKGVDILLSSWRNVQERFTDWELQIVGPDDGGHVPSLQRLAASLGTQRVTFVGFVPEEQKTACLHAADLYILPTHTDNWGVTIGEALAHGLPAIVSTGAPWSGLETHRCGWWIDNSVEAVTECLSSAMAQSPDDLRSRGARARAWMSEEFSWSKVGRMMHETYRWLLDEGTPPPWVRLN